MDTSVKEKFDSYPKHVRKKLIELRALIFAIEEKDEAIGEIEETLKWNEPAYLTSQTKSGTTIRVGWKHK